MINDDVNELATWPGQEIAHYSGCKRKDVGLGFCHAGSTTGLIAFLNNMVGVFEYDVDENGNSGGKIWEWKLCQNYFLLLFIYLYKFLLNFQKFCSLIYIFRYSYLK
jgi:hypothetical protein